MSVFVLARISIRPLQVESVTIEKKPIVENILALLKLSCDRCQIPLPRKRATISQSNLAE
jgi:hypothetical protein